jgi:hypothetical protein
VDFTLTASDGSAQPTQTIKAGTTAVYNLNLNSTAALSGTVTMTCTGAPQHATCSVSPSQLNLSGTAPQAFTVSVNTNVANAAAWLNRLEFPNGEHQFALAGTALVLPLLLWGLLGNSTGAWYTKLRPRVGLLTLILTLALVHIGCGSGGGGNTTPSPTPPITTSNLTPTGTYTITLSATQGTVTRTMKLTLNVQ